MCSPVIPHCKQSQTQQGGRGGWGGTRLNVASQAIKIRRLQLVILGNHRCASIGFKPAEEGRKKERCNLKEC